MKPNTRNLLFIVDDDPDDRQTILDAFHETNSRLDYVLIENGEQLIKTLYASPPEELPSLILLDLNMPGMYGLQILKQIKSNSKFSCIPTIILTTSTLPKDQISSYELGASCFLKKPDSYSELLKITGSIITLWFGIPVLHE